MSSSDSAPFWKSILPRSQDCRWAVSLHLEGGGSVGSEVGVERLRQLQAYRAVGGKVQLLFVQQ